MIGNVESGPVQPRFAVPKPQLVSGSRPRRALFGGLRTAAVAWLQALGALRRADVGDRSWESLVMDQKLPIWNSGCGVLSAFAKLRVIKLQVKAATPTKRLQLPVTRSASWGPGRFELLE